MARLLVGTDKDWHNIECYDPSAGTGTLLMRINALSFHKTFHNVVIKC